MRRFQKALRPVLVLALSAALVDCVPSKLNPQDQVTVSGTALDASGQPLASNKVGLVRLPDLLEVFTGLIVIGGSVGTACLAPDPPAICKSIRVTTTDAKGAFSYQLTGKDTQGSVGQASNWTLSVREPAPGGAIFGAADTASFIINTTDLTVPQLRLWHPKLKLTPGTGSLSLSWTDLKSDVGIAADDYDVRVVNGAFQTVWALQNITGTKTSIDPRALEDFAGAWSVSAHRSVPGTETSFQLTHQSPGAALASQGDVPLSRGKPCYVQLDAAPSPLGDKGVCPVTDGNLGTPYNATGPTCTNQGSTQCTQTSDTWVAIDLGSLTAVHKVFLHNYPVGPALEVEVMGAAGTWLPMGQLTSPGHGFYELALPPGTMASQVRIRSTNAHDKVGPFVELSVF